MVRVLHLLDNPPDFSAEYGSRALAQYAGAGFSVAMRAVGAGGNDRNALLAMWALRRASIERPHIIHAWSLRALWVAVLAGMQPIVFSPAQLPSPRSIQWLAKAVKRRKIHVVCSSVAAQRVYVSNGVSAEQCSVISPGVEVAQVMPGSNRDLRAALGLAEEDYVFLASGESTRLAGHRNALWTASILHVLDRRYRILLWGRGGMTSSYVQLAAKLRQPSLLVTAEQRLGRRIQFEELLPAADAVLFAPEGPTPVLPIAMCLAAGLPIIAAATPWFADLLKDGETAVMVPRRSSRMLAQRVLELREDPAFASRIRESARNEALKSFPLGAFVEQFCEVYRLLG